MKQSYEEKTINNFKKWVLSLFGPLGATYGRVSDLVAHAFYSKFAHFVMITEV